MKTNLSSSRQIATKVVYRVRKDNAYAAKVLDVELQRTSMSKEDRALCTEIVYGTLRRFAEIETLIDSALHRRNKKLDTFLEAALTVAVYQLFFLERVPAYAVVHNAVQIVKHERGEVMGRFANAVLRRLAKTKKDDSSKVPIHWPKWLTEKLFSSLGKERAERFLNPVHIPPYHSIRVRPHENPQQVRKAITDEILQRYPNAEINPSDFLSNTILTRHCGNVRDLDSYKKGLFTIQEEGAQIMASELAAQPSDQIADICAGHGGKTLFFADQVGFSGHIDAVDLYQNKLERIHTEMTRLQIPRKKVQLHTVDMSLGNGALPAIYDRVMVDAPCTGIGTIHRRPDLLMRLTPEKPASMQTLQTSILYNALSLVKPQGILAYVVCSPLDEEGIEVVHQFEEKAKATHPRLRRRNQSLNSLLRVESDSMIRVGPWERKEYSEPDGYQMMVWKVS